MNKKLTMASALAILLVAPLVALADLDVIAEPTRIGAINFVALINATLGLVWLIFVGATVVMLIVTGILFLTTQGDPEKIKKARMSLIFCIIGIVVALLGWRIYATVSNSINPPAPACLVDGEACIDAAKCCSGSCNPFKQCGHFGPIGPI